MRCYRNKDLPSPGVKKFFQHSVLISINSYFFGNSYSPLYFLLQRFFTGIVIVLLKIRVV